MKPSQLISRDKIDDAYDEIHGDMEFAYKRAKVLADMLEIPVHEHPEVTGTILGLVRGSVERLIAEREAAIVEVGLLKQGMWQMKDTEISRWKDAYENMRDFAVKSGLDITCYGTESV